MTRRTQPTRRSLCYRLLFILNITFGLGISAVGVDASDVATPASVNVEAALNEARGDASGRALKDSDQNAKQRSEPGSVVEATDADESLAPNAVKGGRGFWAFRPPLDPEPPTVRESSWARNGLDLFILRHLERAQLSPAPPATRRDFLRRATFDLTGLPPTPSEVESFLADDDPGASERLVDRLLASPRYGERWGRHWLDTVRYADSNGLDENIAHGNIWRYRDYVIDALNVDKPYDTFVMEQLAGDLLADDHGDMARRREQLIATGFLAMGPKVLAESDKKKMEMDIIDEQIDSLGRTFMALTLGCARCHDHKFDPIATEDYYALAGIFKSTKTMESLKTIARWHENSLATPEEEQQHRKLAADITQRQSVVDEVVKESNSELQESIVSRLDEYLLAAAEIDTDDVDGSIDRLAKERGLVPFILANWRKYLASVRNDDTSIFVVWQAVASGIDSASIDTAAVFAEAGGELFSSTDLATLQSIAARYQSLFAAARAQNAEATAEKQSSAPATTTAETTNDRTEAQSSDPLTPFRTLLVDGGGPFSIPSSVTAQEIERHYPQSVRDSLKAKRETIQKLSEALPVLPSAMGVAAGEVTDLPVHIRGSHLALGKVVPRRFPAVLDERQQQLPKTTSGRLELAAWLANRRHPLTARVLVNRLWRWHFGRGLVATPDNFGTRGQTPTNQDLLDWLTHRLIEADWSIKAMHKIIMLSSTYAMSSQYDANAAETDPDNTLLWRAPVRRLEAEAIRDSLLAVSGRLDLQMGGSLLHVDNRKFLFDHTSKDKTTYTAVRRSLYLPVIRNHLYDFFSLYDFPDPAVPSGDRSTTTVAPQALFLMNSPLVRESAEALARSMIDSHSSDRERIAQLYVTLFGREPKAPELKSALAFLGANTPTDVASGRAKANTAPRTSKQSGRLKAWTALVQALLCTNEFVYLK